MQKYDGRTEIYKDNKGRWRWKAIAQNGNVLAVSSQSYKRRAGCMRGLAATERVLVCGDVESE